MKYQVQKSCRRSKVSHSKSATASPSLCFSTLRTLHHILRPSLYIYICNEISLVFPSSPSVHHDSVLIFTVRFARRALSINKSNSCMVYILTTPFQYVLTLLCRDFRLWLYLVVGNPDYALLRLNGVLLQLGGAPLADGGLRDLRYSRRRLAILMREDGSVSSVDSNLVPYSNCLSCEITPDAARDCGYAKWLVVECHCRSQLRMH